MRQMLHIPANPRRQRAVLVILVERREVPPLRVAAHDLRNARFEINPEAFPNQQKQACARWPAFLPPPRPKTCRREKHRDKSRLQQHSIRLVAGKLLRRTHKRKKAHGTNCQHPARPQIQNQQQRRNHPHPANSGKHVSTARKPQQRRRIPVSRVAKSLRHRLQVFAGRKNSVRPNQSANLKYQREKRRVIDEAKSAQKNPAGKQAVRNTALRVEQPAQASCKCPLHGGPPL